MALESPSSLPAGPGLCSESPQIRQPRNGKGAKALEAWLCLWPATGFWLSSLGGVPELSPGKFQPGRGSGFSASLSAPATHRAAAAATLCPHHGDTCVAAPQRQPSRPRSLPQPRPRLGGCQPRAAGCLWPSPGRSGSRVAAGGRGGQRASLRATAGRAAAGTACSGFPSLPSLPKTDSVESVKGLRGVSRAERGGKGGEGISGPGSRGPGLGSPRSPGEPAAQEERVCGSGLRARRDPGPERRGGGGARCSPPARSLLRRGGRGGSPRSAQPAQIPVPAQRGRPPRLGAAARDPAHGGQGLARSRGARPLRWAAGEGGGRRRQRRGPARPDPDPDPDPVHRAPPRLASRGVSWRHPAAAAARPRRDYKSQPALRLAGHAGSQAGHAAQLAGPLPRQAWRGGRYVSAPRRKAVPASLLLLFATAPYGSGGWRLCPGGRRPEADRARRGGKSAGGRVGPCGSGAALRGAFDSETNCGGLSPSRPPGRAGRAPRPAGGPRLRLTARRGREAAVGSAGWLELLRFPRGGVLGPAGAQA
ncbi:translation initiation factor IF-2-like [Aquila chrysaetos chrysaetos]|uniref:translation initiation factor IF-2-like n=1 Tax=Aquila chrysaetos chrysaetos TaxID=223781 RepID=UPI001176951D|nr:translation initiation factor IF-2-like [Aquila chrysaetos chrysaetos]